MCAAQQPSMPHSEATDRVSNDALQERFLRHLRARQQFLALAAMLAMGVLLMAAVASRLLGAPWYVGAIFGGLEIVVIALIWLQVKRAPKCPKCGLRMLRKTTRASSDAKSTTYSCQGCRLSF